MRRHDAPPLPNQTCLDGTLGIARGIVSSSIRMSFLRAKATKMPLAVSQSTSSTKCSLASANSRFLFRAVAAPIGGELVGVGDSVQLTRKTQSDPDADRLFEGSGQHGDLPYGSLSDRSAALAAIAADHPRQGSGHFLMDSGRLCEAAEGFPGGRHRLSCRGLASQWKPLLCPTARADRKYSPFLHQSH